MLLATTSPHQEHQRYLGILKLKIDTLHTITKQANTVFTLKQKQLQIVPDDPFSEPSTSLTEEVTFRFEKK